MRESSKVWRRIYADLSESVADIRPGAVYQERVKEHGVALFHDEMYTGSVGVVVKDAVI